LILARVLWAGDAYGVPYNDLWETISSLYNSSYPEYNPIGAYFFWAAMVLAGSLVLIMMLYSHPRIAQGKKFWARFGSFWMLLSGIGFLLTGLIKQHTLDFISTKFHEITAAVGAFSIFVGAACYGLATLQNKIPVKKNICIITFIVFMGLFIAMIVSAAGAFLVYDFNWSTQTPQPGVSPFFCMSLLEKIGYVVLVVYLGLMGLLLPDQK
jgi:hypothetical protein